VFVLSSDIKFRSARISPFNFSASLLILMNCVRFWYTFCCRSVDVRFFIFCKACWYSSISFSEASLNKPAIYRSGRRLGSFSAFGSISIPWLFPGDGPLPRSLEPVYWFGKDGTEGMGGAVGSKSVGRLLNRVEYRRLTRSDVY
jgi:hypothetical protein